MATRGAESLGNKVEAGVVLLERTMALIGRFARGGGDVGGDSIAVRPRRRRSSRQGAVLSCNAAVLGQRCGEGDVCANVKQSREREY